MQKDVDVVNFVNSSTYVMTIATLLKCFDLPGYIT